MCRPELSGEHSRRRANFPGSARCVIMGISGAGLHYSTRNGPSPPLTARMYSRQDSFHIQVLNTNKSVSITTQF